MIASFEEVEVAIETEQVFSRETPINRVFARSSVKAQKY